MPKEILVFGRTPGQLTAGSDGNGPVTHPSIPTPEFSLHWQPSVNDHMPAWGQIACTINVELLRARLSALTPDVTAISFLSETIERTEFQRSIKALRRARDAVFGADE